MPSVGVIACLVALLTFYSVFNTCTYYYDYILNSGEDLSNENFDFIVVGAGSSGAVVANRLSKNSRVLLLEAGGTPNPAADIPGLAPMFLHQPASDWMYKTVPQKHACISSENNATPWPRGKTLGGSSMLNFMLYVRGHPSDYNLWAELTNDDDWRYDNLLQYFKASIDYRGAFSDNEKHYGQTPYGYMQVTTKTVHPKLPAFMDAGKELGFDVNYDSNGPQRAGFSPAENTISTDKRRQSTYAAFIEKFETRENFKVSRYSVAEKIHIDKTGRAVGVWYSHHGVRKYAKASKEIIISAGAVDSPKLLMNSGVGPKAHLKSMGIKSKVELPGVGKHLQDHIAVQIGPFLINETASFISDRDMGIKSFYDYFIHSKGPLSDQENFGGQIFFSTSSVLKNNGTDWPNIQMYFIPTGVGESAPIEMYDMFRFNLEELKEYLNPVTPNDAFYFMAVLVRPKSRGDIKLANKDPQTPPIIDPKYLSHNEDMEALLEAVDLAMKISETKPFREMDSKLSHVHFPPCKSHKLKSKDYWACYIKHFTFTLYHPTSTCAMGKKGNKDTVVDSKLRVVGVKGLRVADASIMPRLVNGNTNAPCIMIGEKAAAMIRTYWSDQNLVCDYFDYLIKRDCKKCYYTKLF